MQGVYVEFWIFINYSIIVVRANNTVLFLFLCRIDKLGAHIWRPEVCRRIALAAETLLKLTRVEHGY